MAFSPGAAAFSIICVSVLLRGGADQGQQDCDSRESCVSQHAVQANGLLQQASRSHALKLGAEDAGSASKIRASSAGAWLSSLLVEDANAGTALVRAKMDEGRRTAVVSFDHEGKTWSYKLSAFSVYSDDAEVVVHTHSGPESRRPPSGGSSTFKARAHHNKHGLWASAMLHADGSVTGLFEVDGGMLHLEPKEKETELEYGHRVRHFDLPQLFADKGQVPPCVMVDGECVHDGGDDGSDGTDHIPHMSNSSEKPGQVMANLSQWQGGTKWWPGCYSGDSDLHEFKIGAVADWDAFNDLGNKTQPMVESVIATTSLVYEHQFNIKLSIGYLKIYENSTGAPSYASSCFPDLKTMLYDFRAQRVRDVPSGLGAAHLFTGCGTGLGVVGIAFEGTICYGSGYDTGVTELHKFENWLTFAHELGHNFAGQHSFEEGQGVTGGIMDYGDGTLNGQYQFNMKYRKAGMCQKMNSKVNHCSGGFQKAEGTTTTSTNTTNVTDTTTASNSSNPPTAREMALRWG
eukprot:CAMPEP_0170601532 /NCGR_PEP_ID=MMETSP0224-20130122/17912_1 /TAXON_ID=285029 /ORGANISM="Togula jolla, Strain CCCM 725" /LENGTH=516 /DNA_ID=CAMNT_0010926319 /DNA_START=32 /DNA_END=1579 /DNA_ORIENTATION=+